MQFMICLAEAAEWLDGRRAAVRGVRTPRNRFWGPKNLRERGLSIQNEEAVI
jgi:hypothetical protein